VLFGLLSIVFLFFVDIADLKFFLLARLLKVLYIIQHNNHLLLRVFVFNVMIFSRLASFVTRWCRIY